MSATLFDSAHLPRHASFGAALFDHTPADWGQPYDRDRATTPARVAIDKSTDPRFRMSYYEMGHHCGTRTFGTLRPQGDPNHPDNLEWSRGYYDGPEGDRLGADDRRRPVRNCDGRGHHDHPDDRPGPRCPICGGSGVAIDTGLAIDSQLAPLLPLDVDACRDCERPLDASRDIPGDRCMPCVEADAPADLDPRCTPVRLGNVTRRPDGRGPLCTVSGYDMAWFSGYSAGLDEASSTPPASLGNVLAGAWLLGWSESQSVLAARADDYLDEIKAKADDLDALHALTSHDGF